MPAKAWVKGWEASMSAAEGRRRALPAGQGQRSSSTELDRVDLQVTDARARVERWTRQVEDDMGRGRLATYSRELLASCQEILREMIGHRDAVVVGFMKGKQETESEFR